MTLGAPESAATAIAQGELRSPKLLPQIWFSFNPTLFRSRQFAGIDIFSFGADPVKVGLVASLNRPGGNSTGFGEMNIEVAPKRLEILHEFIPAATRNVLGAENPTDAVGCQRRQHQRCPSP